MVIPLMLMVPNNSQESLKTFLSCYVCSYIFRYLFAINNCYINVFHICSYENFSNETYILDRCTLNILNLKFSKRNKRVCKMLTFKHENFAFTYKKLLLKNFKEFERSSTQLWTMISLYLILKPSNFEVCDLTARPMKLIYLMKLNIYTYMHHIQECGNSADI